VGVLLKTPKSNASIIKTITKKEIQTIINRDVFRFTKILLIANLESYSNKVGFRLNRTFGFSQNTNLKIYGLKLMGCQLNWIFSRKM
jgi:hypothetical protein